MHSELRLEHEGRVLADRLVVAVGMWDRMRGLLGRSDFASGEALLLSGANQIHTFGMTFSIDVLFLDAEQRVVHLIRAMRPWRISRWVRRARCIVELPAGAASEVDIGDLVLLKPR